MFYAQERIQKDIILLLEAFGHCTAEGLRRKIGIMYADTGYPIRCPNEEIDSIACRYRLWLPRRLRPALLPTLLRPRKQAFQEALEANAAMGWVMRPAGELYALTLKGRHLGSEKRHERLEEIRAIFRIAA